MRYANTGSDKTEAAPNVLFATCPCCNEDVIPKCGNIKAWHFAHKAKSDCKYKPMTEWHYEWQSNFNKNFLEVIHKDRNTGEKHIADVKNSAGVVIEFQHSSISQDEVESRESFYKKMVWVLDGSAFKVKESDKTNHHCIDLTENTYDLYHNGVYIIPNTSTYTKVIFKFYSEWFLSIGIKNEHELNDALYRSSKYNDKKIITISKIMAKFSSHIFIDNLDSTMWHIEPILNDYYIKSFNNANSKFSYSLLDYKPTIGFGGMCGKPYREIDNLILVNNNLEFTKFGNMRFASLVSKESFIKKYNQ